MLLAVAVAVEQQRQAFRSEETAAEETAVIVIPPQQTVQLIQAAALVDLDGQPVAFKADAGEAPVL
jgi:hypothetical protein